MEIIKVLLVDDDAAMRISLSGLIPWEEYGYELLPGAADGEEALCICRETPPDIVITDMQMPGMNGIVFLKELKAMNQNPYILVLSGYDEFELVREAMRLGVSDYILKLELSANGLLERLPNREKRENEMQMRIRQRNQVFRDIINHYYYSNFQMQKRMDEAGIFFKSDTVWCFLISSDSLYRFEDATDEEYQALMTSYLNITREVLSDCADIFCVPGKTGEMYVFGCIKTEFKGKEDLIQWLGERLHEMIGTYLGLQCCVGIADGGNNPDGIYESASNAAHMIRMRYLTGGKRVLMREDFDNPIPHGSLWNYQIRSELKASLERLNIEEIHNVFYIAKEKIKSVTAGERIELIMEFISCAREQLEYFGHEPDEYLSESMRAVGELSKIYYFNEIHNCFDLLESEITKWLQFNQNSAGRTGIVEMACERIEAEFASALNLSRLAAELSVSPGYLSAMMKKQTGKNFTGYLMDVRIMHSQDLLQKTDESLSVIAEKVGFTDQYYFSRQFKRITGKSPGTWRRDKRGMAN